MSHKNYCIVSGALFFLVALAHLARIIGNTPIQVDNFVVPMLVSWMGLPITAVLAFWALKIAQKSGVT